MSAGQIEVRRVYAGVFGADSEQELGVARNLKTCWSARSCKPDIVVAVDAKPCGSMKRFCPRRKGVCVCAIEAKHGWRSDDVV
jgi:hypothetical protein